MATPAAARPRRLTVSRVVGAWDHWDGIVALQLTRQNLPAAPPLFDWDDPDWSGGAAPQLVIGRADMAILTKYCGHDSARRDQLIPLNSVEATGANDIESGVLDPRTVGRGRNAARALQQLIRPNIRPDTSLDTITAISAYHAPPAPGANLPDVGAPWYQTGPSPAIPDCPDPVFRADIPAGGFDRLRAWLDLD